MQIRQRILVGKQIFFGLHKLLPENGEGNNHDAAARSFRDMAAKLSIPALF